MPSRTGVAVSVNTSRTSFGVLRVLGFDVSQTLPSGVTVAAERAELENLFHARILIEGGEARFASEPTREELSNHPVESVYFPSPESFLREVQRLHRVELEVRRLIVEGHVDRAALPDWLLEAEKLQAAGERSLLHWTDYQFIPDPIAEALAFSSRRCGQHRARVLRPTSASIVSHGSLEPYCHGSA